MSTTRSPVPDTLFLLILLLGGLGTAAHGAETLTVGYLDLADDPRYRDEYREEELRGLPWGRPYAGAELAAREARFPLAAVGLALDLRHESAAGPEELPARLAVLRQAGAAAVLVDLPGERLAALAADDLLLLNVSARDDALRQTQCRANLLHLIPAEAMYQDALAQYLVARKWRQVLVLQGPAAADAARVASFQRAAGRFGLKIVAVRPFVYGNDPRQREQNNLALLTSGADYDVLYIADAGAEFAREAAYRGQLPRPLVGAEGLLAEAWHWAWERHGAPQLNKRFRKQTGRPMDDAAWAAWLGVKALAEAALRTQSRDPAQLAAYLRGAGLVLDGFKGYRLDFRSWDGQLRQPLLLTSHNWVVERAPLEGFLHQSNNLDTLGFDRPDSRCRAGGG
ncbi:MAG TPA: ABC transporter substrate-binding protein [Candidatus Competibacteraceae bacterium]|nr:ABC transporter substrate-binding protein [Candidatus Competibacteraceae bacterium]